MDSSRCITIRLSLGWRFFLVLALALTFIFYFYLGSSPGSWMGTASSAASLSAAVAAGGTAGESPALLATSSVKRRYYMSNDINMGSAADQQCAAGYAFASMWELLDTSNLSYAYDIPEAYIRTDSGQGPPIGTFAWVRTGRNSSTSNVPGTGNCSNWTSVSSLSYGTMIRLPSDWGTSLNPTTFWISSTQACNLSARSWCIEAR